MKNLVLSVFNSVASFFEKIHKKSIFHNIDVDRMPWNRFVWSLKSKYDTSFVCVF